MAIATNNAAVRVAYAPISFFGKLAKAYRVWRDYRDTSRDLNQLSKRQLADIGVDGDSDEFAWRLAEDRNRL